MLPTLYIFHILANRKPQNAPIKREGAKVPPHPPPPFVADVAKTFVNNTRATYKSNNFSLP